MKCEAIGLAAVWLFLVAVCGFLWFVNKGHA